MTDNQAENKLSIQVFMISERANYHASGIFDGTGILVLKNSVVSSSVTDPRLYAEKRAEALTEDFILKEDVYFNSPSSAALFVCGRSANGWVEWRLESGEKLQILRNNHTKKNTASENTQKKATVSVPAVEQKGNTRRKRILKRLLTRVNKDFEKKFFIGDIVVSDQDYELLKDESKRIVRIISDSGMAVSESVVLAITLVQIGIRRYDGRHFWPYAEEELGFTNTSKLQQLLGDSFINTLSKHGKHITDYSEKVQNILFHGFVSNYYSKGLFELLFQYYTKDLERDIDRNTTQQMQALMETLAKKAFLDEKQNEAFTSQFMSKGSRAYKLKNHTLQAISAQPIHSRTRLRRLLRLIDRAFWNNETPKNPSSRLTILFKDWIEDSAAFEKDYHLYQMGEIRNRGKKHFSSPYLFANIGTDRFELKLPAQIVHEDYSEGLLWKIITKTRAISVEADTYPVLTGFKTEEISIAVSDEELFGDIQCRLVQDNFVVRKFPNLPNSEVRFFDTEGDYASRLFKIPMCAYTVNGSTLQSSALISKEPRGSITRWDFDFQRGDIVILPDGSGITVGNSHSEGLLPRGQVSCARYEEQNGDLLPVYAAPPEIVLTIPEEKIAGTVIYCNDIRYRLSECRYTEFSNRDMHGVQSVLLSAEQFDCCKKDGIITIILDIPGAHFDKKLSFALIKNLTVEFPGAPYIFKEQGAVLFPDCFSLGGDHEKLQDENGFRFELDGSVTELHISVNKMPLSVRIPFLSWSTDKENWSILPAGEMWHTDFFEIKKLYIRCPAVKISIFTDADIEDEKYDTHSLSAQSDADGIFSVDMTRFRSWLTRDNLKNDIFLRIDKDEYAFATVYTGSIVASYDVSADYEEGTLTWLCDIIGQADYYIDIVHMETEIVIADKAPVHNGRLIIKDKLRTGIYKFTLFEAEEDDSGFDELLYEEFFSAEKQLVNRNDVSGQFLEIKSYKRIAQSTIYTYFKKKYFVTDFEKIDKNLYSGYLIIDGEKTELKVTIEYLRSGDMRFFHVTAWHSEEECDVDLLYDRVQGTLELDQLPGLRSSESYRRYRELTYGEVVYFGTLHEKLPDLVSL